jgi:hypothetical protein
MVCVTIQYYVEANDLLHLNIFYSVMLRIMWLIIEHIYIKVF